MPSPLFINRHAKKPINSAFFENNVKYDRNTKNLKFKVAKHNYKIMGFPFWKIKALKKLGRTYRYKFKKSPKKRKFFKQTLGYFSLILQSLSFRSSASWFLEKNLFTLIDDYRNNPKNKVFFFKVAYKNFLKKNRKIKHFRKKIIIRRVFSKRFGINSNKKFYYVHKSFSKKKAAVLRWLNFVEMRLPNLIFNLGWTYSMREANRMVKSGYILLNGSRDLSRFHSKVAAGDVVSLTKYIYYLRKQYFFKRLNNWYQYNFINWYLGFKPFFLNKKYKYRLEAGQEAVDIQKRFWASRTFEWKFSSAKALRSLTCFGRKSQSPIEFSNKKIAVYFKNNINYFNFLRVYTNSKFKSNRKLIDFFLHNNYF